MKAIVLAAGLGRRMLPLSKNTHKCLLDVGGVTILGRILDNLQAAGISDVSIVTGYLANDIEEYVRSHHTDFVLEFIHNGEYENTNNIVSFALALERTPRNTDILLIECDLVFDSSVLKQLDSFEGENVAFVSSYHPGLDGTVVSLAEEYVDQIYPPHLQSNRFQFRDKYKTLNIYQFSSKLVDIQLRAFLSIYRETIGTSSYYELILGLILYLGRTKIRAIKVEPHRWTEVDDPNDLWNTRFEFENTKRAKLLNELKGGYWSFDFIDFHFIRNMHFPPPDVLATLREFLPDLMWNYGSSQTTLNRKLSYALSCKTSRLSILNGASQAFPILKRWFQNKSIRYPEPTFGEYARSFPNGEAYQDWPPIDYQELQEKAEMCDVMVLVNPNNPTGSVRETKKIISMASDCRNTLFLVDESFIEFSDQASLIDELECTPLDNIIVLKSLSKVYGVPGIRLGCLYCCDESLVRKMNNEIPIWNSNSIAESFIEQLLKHRDELQKSFEITKQDRNDLIALLKQLNCIETVYDSGANFILIELKRGFECLSEQLLEKDRIYVKNEASRTGLGERFVRIAVRTKHDNKYLVNRISALEKIIE